MGRRTVRLSRHLVALILAAILPLVLGLAVAIVLAVRHERHQIEDTLMSLVRAMAVAFDGEAQDSIGALRSISHSTSLRAGRLTEFYEEAHRHLRARPQWHSIMLTDGTGKPLLHTSVPFGADFPPLPGDAHARSVLATGHASISPTLTIGRITGERIIPIAVPVHVDGSLAYVLVAGYKLPALSQVFANIRLSQRWTAAVFDRNGTLIARSRAAEQFVGRKATEGLLKLATGTGEARIWEPTKDGIQTFAVVTRVPRAPWSVIIGIPEEEYWAPVKRTAFLVGGIGSAIILLGAICAGALGRRIAGSIRAASAAASALKDERPVSISAKTRIAEVRELYDALGAASVKIRARSDERDRAIENLRRLAETNTRLTAAIGAMSTGVIMTDAQAPDYSIVFANDGLLRLTGYERSEVLDQRAKMLCGPETDMDEFKRLWQRVSAGHSGSAIARLYRKDGSAFWGDVHVSPGRDEAGQIAFYVAILNDVTARIEAEERLRHSAKMDAVGQLTGGVAHDFNNLLTVIIGNLDVLTNRPRGGGELRAYAENALKAAERAADITQRLLAFSRRQKLALDYVDLNALIDDMQPLLHQALSSQITLVKRFAPQSPGAVVDRSELQSAIINLAANARDAMAEGGVLTIETGEIELTQESSKACDTAPGRYATIRIADTGAGMPPEVLAHAFEPFSRPKRSARARASGSQRSMASSNSAAGSCVSKARWAAVRPSHWVSRLRNRPLEPHVPPRGMSSVHPEAVSPSWSSRMTRRSRASPLGNCSHSVIAC